MILLSMYADNYSDNIMKYTLAVYTYNRHKQLTIYNPRVTNKYWEQYLSMWGYKRVYK